MANNVRVIIIVHVISGDAQTRIQTDTEKGKAILRPASHMLHTQLAGKITTTMLFRQYCLCVATNTSYT